MLQHRYTVWPLTSGVVVTAQVHSVVSPLRKEPCVYSVATHLWDRCDSTGTHYGLIFKEGVVVTAQVHSEATFL